jgi:hypothetical protein
MAAVGILQVSAAFVLAISGILRNHLVIIQNMLELCHTTTLYHMTAKPECNFPLQAVNIKFTVHQQLQFLQEISHCPMGQCACKIGYIPSRRQGVAHQ